MQVIDILNKKIELFDKVLELSKQQSEMLEKDDVDELNVITDKKQVLIDQLEEIDKIGAVDPKNFDMESKELNKRLRFIIDKVLQIDKKNNETTKSMIGQQVKEIKKINSDRKRMQLYRNTARSTDGIYIDKKK